MPKTKVLYINELDFHKVHNGGSNGESSHLKALENMYIVEKTNVFANDKRSKFQLLVDCLSSPVPIFYSRNQTRKISNLIKTSKAEIVFIENSNLGYFAKIAKKCGKTVAVFFHNCEIEFARSCRNKIWLKSVYRNEAASLNYADYAFILNDRDENDIKRFYSHIRSKIVRLPVAMEDKLTQEDEETLKQTRRKNHVVFVGSLFKPNVEAVCFINDKIASECPNAIFDIWGFRMEELKMEFKPNVHNHGTAKDLRDCFMNADVMLFPVFSGSGMKIKTEESLMYGKYVIGSPEAFCGYPSQKMDCFVCKTETQYIEAIKRLIDCGVRFSETNRKLWVTNFTISKIEETIKNTLGELK